jgi:cytochrome b6-f complex iron-sulfur subunit
MNLDKHTRRMFCSRTCTAAAAAAMGGALGTILSSCGGGSSPTSPGGGGATALPTVPGTASGATIQVAIDAGSPLAATGSVALVRAGGRSILVARTGTDSFSALSSTCTHEGCAITAFVGQDFVCLCHGAEFDSSGLVVAGPTRTPLPQYPTQFENGLLTINA